MIIDFIGYLKNGRYAARLRGILIKPKRLGRCADVPTLAAEKEQTIMIEMRRATSKEDISGIALLAQEIWNEHYVGIIGQDQVDYMLDKFQSRQAIEEQTAHGYQYYFIVHHREVVGYIALVPEPEKSAIFLSKIYVRKQSRGLQLGKSAIHFIEKICQNRNLRTIRLTVNKNNRRSIAFYERMGFRKTGSTVHDIGGGFIMDDFVMEKAVCS